MDYDDEPRQRIVVPLRLCAYCLRMDLHIHINNDGNDAGTAESATPQR